MRGKIAAEKHWSLNVLVVISVRIRPVKGGLSAYFTGNAETEYRPLQELLLAETKVRRPMSPVGHRTLCFATIKLAIRKMPKLTARSCITDVSALYYIY